MSEVPPVQLSVTGGFNDGTTPRACQTCRLRKIRCLQDSPAPSVKCLPCAKSNRECIYIERSRTRRRKRTDTRVTDLEREVKAMVSLLKKKTPGKVQTLTEEEDSRVVDRKPQITGENRVLDANRALTVPGTHSTFPPGTSQQPPRNDFDKQDRSHDTSKFRVYEESKSWSGIPQGNNVFAEVGLGDHGNSNNNPVHSSKDADVIDRGLLSMHVASQIYDRYVAELVPLFPIVLLPKAAASSVRKEKPTLFLAVIAAAAATFNEDLYLSLNKEILETYADKITIKGQRSIELIQSLLVTVVWCCPPDSFDSLKFYQFIHMAATMALDLGITKKGIIHDKQLESTVLDKIDTFPSNSNNALNREESRGKPSAESGIAESRRTLLACYLMCSSVSISLRRPNMFRFSNWMAECMEYLETSSDAAPTDKLLIAWIKLQRIMEECGNSFSFDDPSSTPSLSENHTQFVLRGFEKQLENWKNNTTPSLMDQALFMNFHVNNVYLHEISMHPDHDSEDFRPPYVVKTAMRPSKVSLSPVYVEAIMMCVSSSHIFLNTFLEMTIETLRALPIFQWVRMVYGAIVLIKLSLSASTPTSEIGKVLDHDSLQVSQYMDKLIVHIMRVLGPDKNRVAAKFLTILMKLKSWHSQQVLRFCIQNGPEEEFEPCKHLEPLPKAAQDILYPSQPGWSVQTGPEATHDQSKPQRDPTGSMQQQSPISNPPLPENSHDFKPSVLGVPESHGFPNYQTLDPSNPPSVASATDSTLVPTYDDQFNMMDLDQGQLDDFISHEFSPEELDAWLYSQGMPGLVSTSPTELQGQVSFGANGSLDLGDLTEFK